MTEFAANLLINAIERDRRWPPRFDREAIALVARRAAFRESDEEALRQFAGWKPTREYMIDPLADRICQARADLLFGEDPRITAAAEGDRKSGNLDRIIELNDLPSELHYAEQLRASEGEVWYRLMSDRDSIDAPLITFHSREVVVPMYVGAALVACAFASEFEDPRDLDRTDRHNRRVWRLLEIQSIGRVENRLYLGTRDRLGEPQDLDAFDETADLTSVWDTEVPDILAGRVIYRRGREVALGRSIYTGSQALLLALNEAMTIGVENARLVAKKRAIVPPEALDRDDDLPDSIDVGDGSRAPVRRGPHWDGGEDLLVAGGALDAELGKENAGANVFKVLEYAFDSQALVTWQDALVRTIATRCGLTVQFLGVGSEAGEGTAATGTALRVRLLPATSSAAGTARPWVGKRAGTGALQKILLLAQLLDAASVGNGGFGRTWSEAGTAPDVDIADPLPRDETEEVSREVTATGGSVRSVREAVRRLNPDWDDPRIDEEVDSIREDEKNRTPVGLALPGPTDEGDDGDNPPEPPAQDG